MICFSQDIESELWLKMNFKEKIYDNFNISFEPGSRYNIDDFFFTKQFLDASSELIIHKGKIGTLSFELGGRLTKIPNQDKLGSRHYYTLFYSKKINNFDLSLRSRLFFEKDLTKYDKKYFRNKFSIQYSNYKLLRPFIDFEFLNSLNSENENKIRYSFGNSFKISKKEQLNYFIDYKNLPRIIKIKKKFFWYLPNSKNYK